MIHDRCEDSRDDGGERTTTQYEGCGDENVRPEANNGIGRTEDRSVHWQLT